jgi:hypothetical protein
MSIIKADLRSRNNRGQVNTYLLMPGPIPSSLSQVLSRVCRKFITAHGAVLSQLDVIACHSSLGKRLAPGS